MLLGAVPGVLLAGQGVGPPSLVPHGSGVAKGSGRRLSSTGARSVAKLRCDALALRLRRPRKVMKAAVSQRGRAPRSTAAASVACVREKKYVRRG